jgi:hypothetical protein
VDGAVYRPPTVLPTERAYLRLIVRGYAMQGNRLSPEMRHRQDHAAHETPVGG